MWRIYTMGPRKSGVYSHMKKKFMYAYRCNVFSTQVMYICTHKYLQVCFMCTIHIFSKKSQGIQDHGIIYVVLSIMQCLLHC